MAAIIDIEVVAVGTGDRGVPYRSEQQEGGWRYDQTLLGKPQDRALGALLPTH